MKIYFKLTYINVRISSIISFYLIKNILCSKLTENKDTFNIPHNYTDADVNAVRRIIEKDNITTISSTGFTTQIDITTAKHPYLIHNIPENQELCTLFTRQNEQILQIKDILNKTRVDNNWKYFIERSHIKALYTKFIHFTILIQVNMINAHRKLFGFYNHKMKLVSDNIDDIILAKSIVMGDIQNKHAQINKLVRLKETLKGIKEFHSEIDATYCFHKEKRDILAKCISNLRLSFNMITADMKNISKKIITDDFNYIKGKILGVFELFDENYSYSIIKIDKSIKNMIEISLKELTKVNDDIFNFVRPC